MELFDNLLLGLTVAITPINIVYLLAGALIGMVIQLGHRMLGEGEPGPVEAAKFCTRFTIGAMLAFLPKDKLENVTGLMTTLGW